MDTEKIAQESELIQYKVNGTNTNKWVVRGSNQGPYARYSPGTDA